MKRTFFLALMALTVFTAVNAIVPQWYWTQDNLLYNSNYADGAYSSENIIAIPQSDCFPVNVVLRNADPAAPQLNYCQRTAGGWSGFTPLIQLPHKVAYLAHSGYSVATDPTGQYVYVVYTDNIYLNWQGTGWGHIVISMMRSSDWGASWQDMGVITPAGNPLDPNMPKYHEPSVVASANGKVFVVTQRGWLYEPHKISFAYSTDYGVTWQWTENIDPQYDGSSNYSKYYPTIDADAMGNYVHVAWMRMNSYAHTYSIAYGRYTFNSHNWSSATEIASFVYGTAGGQPQNDVPSAPHISCSKSAPSQVHVVWHDNSAHPRGTISYDVHYNRSIDNGTSWGANQIISSNANININSQYPVICVGPNSSTTVDLAYTENNTQVVNSEQTYYRRSTNGGTSWGSISQLSTTGRNTGGFVATDLYDDAEYIFPSIRNGSSSAIYEKRYYIYPNPGQQSPPHRGYDDGIESEPVVNSTNGVRISPNPAKGAVSISLNLVGNASRPVTAKIYDVQGRQVRSLTLANNAGQFTARWDGKNTSGQSVASGVYMVSVKANGFTKTGRITLTR